jgi:hypothetical protein
MTIGIIGKMCSPVEFWGWWFLHFATSNFFQCHLMKTDYGLTHTPGTFSTLISWRTTRNPRPWIALTLCRTGPLEALMDWKWETRAKAKH